MDYLAGHVELYAKWNKSILLTEFACGDTPHLAQNATYQMEYMKSAVTYLEQEPRVEGYAWFAGRTDRFASSLLAPARSSLTDLGLAYACLHEQPHVHLPKPPSSSMKVLSWVVSLSLVVGAVYCILTRKVVVQ